MNFCAIDWNELIKILTPFIITFAVYRVWHNQKGKEVVANTAKEAITDLLEEIATITLIAFKEPNDHNAIKEELVKFNRLTLKTFRSLAFLSECLNDEELEKLLDNYNKQSGNMKIIIRVQPNLSDNESLEKFTITKSDYEEFTGSIEKLIKKIKPYATYKKRFKFNSGS
ncbi:hypothetical protein [Acinetobacter guillouiae]|uniref:hypothetical protein n=1 Tax=Acinetobacter guillouiae TaxID=106649 RepID=UPI002E24EBEF